jgi:hypothetical protein
MPKVHDKNDNPVAGTFLLRGERAAESGSNAQSRK